MNSHTNHEIECEAYAIYKIEKKSHLKKIFPNLKDNDIERKLSAEWYLMSEEDKIPFIKIAESILIGQKQT